MNSGDIASLQFAKLSYNLISVWVYRGIYLQLEVINKLRTRGALPAEMPLGFVFHGFVDGILGYISWIFMEFDSDMDIHGI